MPIQAQRRSGRVYHPHLAIHAAPQAFAAALEASSLARAAPDVGAAHQEYLRLVTEAPCPSRGELICRKSWSGCATIWPDDAIICNGAGNYAGWIHRFYRFRRFDTQMGTVCGFMGYGVPAAVAMKSALSPAHRGCHQRRRRLPDERPGTGHCRAIQAADHCPGAGQCHLRHHPHASGARISRPRLRRPIWSIPISPPWQEASAVSAPPWKRPQISRPPSSRPQAAVCRRSFM